MLTLLGAAKQILLPPLSLTILALAGVLAERRHPALGRTLALSSLALIYALSTPLVADALIQTVQEENSTDRTGQAIVVLSAGSQPFTSEYRGTTADALTLERRRDAAKLERELKLPLLVSGGRLNDDEPPIAEIMNRILVNEYAMPQAWIERTSWNTATNASNSTPILKLHGIAKIYLVTHAWHMKRARMAFEHEGITVLAAGTGHIPPRERIEPADVLPSLRSFNKSYYAIHELIGLAEYSLTL